MRKPLRWAHLLVAMLIGAYVYSPTLGSSPLYQSLIQFVVFPLLGVSGIAMWQQARLARLLRRG